MSHSKILLHQFFVCSSYIVAYVQMWIPFIRKQLGFFSWLKVGYCNVDTGISEFPSLSQRGSVALLMILLSVLCLISTLFCFSPILLHRNRIVCKQWLINMWYSVIWTRLLRSMGWTETGDDNDSYEITEDDVREFENLCRQMKHNKVRWIISSVVCSC